MLKIPASFVDSHFKLEISLIDADFHHYDKRIIVFWQNICILSADTSSSDEKDLLSSNKFSSASIEIEAAIRFDRQFR